MDAEVGVIFSTEPFRAHVGAGDSDGIIQILSAVWH